MKKILPVSIFCLSLCACSFASSTSKRTTSLLVVYDNNLPKNDFKLSIGVGLYRYGNYLEKYKYEAGAFLYVQNTSKENGNLDYNLDFENGYFLFNTEGLDDLYGFEEKNDGTCEYAFYKEYSLSEDLFCYSSGWLTFSMGLYSLTSRNYAEPACGVTWYCHYSISDKNIVIFEKDDGHYEEYSNNSSPNIAYIHSI